MSEHTEPDFLSALVAKVGEWRKAADSDHFVWRSGGDERYRWRSTTRTLCADELDALIGGVREALGKQDAQHLHTLVNRVTRIEVIDDQCRQFTRRQTAIGLSFQDNGRTLKVFVKGDGVTAPPDGSSPGGSPTTILRASEHLALSEGQDLRADDRKGSER